MQNPLVHILLATYNGGKFIREQLDSLFTQTFQDFTILIRDDGSSDDTLNILSEYQQKFPGRIQWIRDDQKNAGATQNFGILLQHSNADHIFFCDQDDRWLNDKMEKELEKIRALEKDDPSVPCMVFSDMKLMDESGNILADSAWKDLHLSPACFTLNRLLVQNIPHGCTLVINKAMRDLASPLPAEAILHDHWIALLAASCGKWDFIAEPTMLLRNHAQNVTRKPASFGAKLKRFSSNLFSGEAYEYFIRIRVAQARALQKRCSGRLSGEQAALISDFTRLESTKGMARRKIFLRHKFFRTTFWHTAKMILRA